MKILIAEGSSSILIAVGQLLDHAGAPKQKWLQLLRSHGRVGRSIAGKILMEQRVKTLQNLVGEHRGGIYSIYSTLSYSRAHFLVARESEIERDASKQPHRTVWEHLETFETIQKLLE